MWDGVADNFKKLESETGKFGKQVELASTSGVWEHGMFVKLICERGISYSPLQDVSIGEQV